MNRWPLFLLLSLIATCPAGAQSAPVKPDSNADSASASIHRQAGHTLYIRGDLSAAVAEFDEAIKLDPKESISFYQRGIAKQEQKKPDEAMADFNQAILLNPVEGLFYYSRGITWETKADSVKALADFDKAIELKPNFARAYIERALVRFKQHDYAGAKADNARVHALDPHYIEDPDTAKMMEAISKMNLPSDPSAAADAKPAAATPTPVITPAPQKQAPPVVPHGVD